MVAPRKIDVAALRSYSTVRQTEILDVWESLEKPTIKAVAAKLKVDHGSISRSLDCLERRAATQSIDIHRTKIDTVPALPEMLEEPPIYAQSLPRPPEKRGKKIMVIPDVQAKPGIDFSFLMRIGQYMVEKKPDIVVCIGDFADMPSLSGYDKGKRSFEGRRYKRDVEAAHWAMGALMTPLTDYNAKAKRPYKPRMVLTLGNHEHRVDRATDDDPKLEGVLSIRDLKYEDFGWEVYPFLQPVIIEGVAFCHYFVSGVMGRPTGTAAAQLRAASMSCFAGHQQGKQIAYARRADGSILTSIIAGSCYEHDEHFLGPQMNRQHWRGFFMLHDVKNGTFDEMPVSLSYINQQYPKLIAPTPNYSLPTEAELQAGRM